MSDASVDQEALKRIEHYIGSPPENSRVFTFTPAMCKYLLDKYNTGNRPRKPKKIDLYSKHMLADTWMLTGDTVKYSDANVMRDGQNRFMASIRSGRPFTTHVVFGIEDDAFKIMDQGQNRDGSDILAIAGYTNTRILSGAVRWTVLLEAGRVKNRDMIQPDEALRLVRDRFPKLPDFISQARAIYSLTGQPAGMVAALLYQFHRHNPEIAAGFGNAWASGQYGGRFGAIGKMQKLIGSLMASSSGRVHEVVRMALIIRAWRLCIEGRRGTSKDFEWTPAEDFPAIGG